MEEKGVVKYEAKDGQEVTLSFDVITKFLVQGHAEYVTRQEMVYFMGICQSRGLNPFNKDCYLMKYSRDDNAAIIVAIDFKRKRARSQKDCMGWSKGIIVKRENEIIYSKGLMLDDDELLGGWFKAQPQGWTEPFIHEVNLNGFIKKTRQGEITRFWQKDNQPMMIAKVAESQGLTALWPGELGKLYTPEELGQSDMFKEVQETIQSKEIMPLETAAGTGTDIYKDKGKESDEVLEYQEIDSFEKLKAWHKEHYPECDFIPETQRGLKKHITQSHKEAKETTKNKTIWLHCPKYNCRKTIKYCQQICAEEIRMACEPFKKQMEINIQSDKINWADDDIWKDKIIHFSDEDELGIKSFNRILRTDFLTEDIDMIPVERREECWNFMNRQLDMKKNQT